MPSEAFARLATPLALEVRATATSPASAPARVAVTPTKPVAPAARLAGLVTVSWPIAVVATASRLSW